MTLARVLRSRGRVFALRLNLVFTGRDHRGITGYARISWRELRSWRGRVP